MIGTLILVPSALALLGSAAWLLRFLREAPAAQLGLMFLLFLVFAVFTVAAAWIGGIGIHPIQHPDFACKGCGRPPVPHARFCMHCGTASSFMHPANIRHAGPRR